MSSSERVFGLIVSFISAKNEHKVPLYDTAYFFKKVHTAVFNP